MTRRVLLVPAAAVIAVLCGAACSKHTDNPAKQDALLAGPATANSGAVAAVTRLVQSDVDAVPALVNELLSSLAAAGQAHPDQLRISYAGESIPLDWWLWNRGLIEFRAVDPSGQPMVGVSKIGMALLAKPATWFTLVATLDPSSTCDNAGSLTASRCNLKVVYAAGMNPQGLATAGNVAPIPMTVVDIANSDGKIWTADAVDYGAFGNPSGAILNAMLGPPADRDAARQRFMAELAQKAGSTSPATAN